jgi:glycerol kinase
VILGIDAGPTAVTAVVVGDDGAVAARGRHDLPRHHPQPGWVEHAPEELWQAVLAATRDAVAQVDATRLRGVGVTGQRGTVVLWDRDTLGSPRRAVAAADRRTSGLCARLRDAGHAERVAELAGLPLEPGAGGPALAWLAEHEPHTWALVEADRYAVGTVDSYLVARMTRGLEHLTDVSNAAGTLLLDLATGGWSDELCGLFGVPRDALPELVPTWGDLAVTEPRTFLGLELPVTGIAGDAQAALIGLACVDAGDAACTYGDGAAETSVLVLADSSPVRADGLLTTAAWRSPDGELRYALEGVVPAGPPEDVVPGVRAVLAAAPAVAARLRVGGPPAADDALCQQQADALGVVVERPASVEVTAVGAAYLAGLGAGVWRSLDAVRDAWPLDRSFAPGAQER